MSKRSTSVSVGLVTALAVSLTGCDMDGNQSAAQAKRCVSSQNVVIDQQNCQPRSDGSTFGHWYYGGGGGYYPGAPIFGGSYTPTVKGSSSGSVSRGGFGTSSSGHSSSS